MFAATGTQAATVTVGSPLTANFTGTFGGPVTDVNTALPEPGATVISPVDGTIINWKAIVGHVGGLTIKVIKPATGGAYTGGFSTFVTAQATGMQTFPGQGLSVHAGDLIGIDIQDTAATVKEANPVPGATIREWAPPLFEGSSLPPDNTYGDSELAYNANVEYCLVPKLKGLKLGAAKRAIVNGACRVGDVAGSKKGKAKFVKSQSVAPGTALADQATINLKLRRKQKK
jgi:hypothetical protein